MARTIRTLDGVVEFEKSKLNRELKRHEMNLILDKYNYDKDKLFSDTTIEARALDKIKEMGDELVKPKVITKVPDDFADATVIIGLKLLELREDFANEAQDLIAEYAEVFELLQYTFHMVRDDAFPNIINFVITFSSTFKDLDEAVKETKEFFKEMGIEISIELDAEVKSFEILIEGKTFNPK